MPNVLKEKTPAAFIAGGEELYAQGYYYRTLRAKGRDGARKQLRITAKRYKCFSQSFERIGLMKWQRRSKPLNDAMSRECANVVGNKKIARSFT